MSETTGVLEQVVELLLQVTGVEEVTRRPDLPLYEQQILDSLGTVELIVGLERTFHVEISPAELERERWATPALIAQDIEQRLRR